MKYKFDFSVIIPHRNSVSLLPQLFSSIPKDDRIEIIIVDNSPTPVSKEGINIDRDYKLFYSLPERGAGGARNVGIENAHGKWLLFLDADDYYADGAFDVFYQYVDSDAEIIYTGMGGIYSDTGEPSDRGDRYAKLVRDYLNGEIDETTLRLTFTSPCCKMVSHDLVIRHNLRYDEVVASNDMYFSLLSGYYAKRIDAVDFVSYIATVSRGSLTKRQDFPVIKARYEVKLRYNLFVRKNGLSQYQHSIMTYIYQSRKFGVKVVFEFLGLLIKYHQNPFVGCSHWFKGYYNKKKYDKRDYKYITS